MTSASQTEAAPSCPFCQIGVDPARAVVLYEDPDVVAFLDRAAIRPGHAQIIAREHVPTFEVLSPQLLLKIATLGQQLARRMKAVYQVERVAFLFTGGDVAHVHAHVVPMHEKTDITSARYIVSPDNLAWGSAYLQMDRAALIAVRDQLAFGASALR
ncbi:MAG: HIT family protein [Chloroflexota bacterium]|nr:HIT family protein [Chloroflexota bacterium]